MITLNTVNRAIERREERIAYLFLTPMLIGFMVFVIYPIIFSLYLSFCNWDVMTGVENIKFKGLINYINLAGDKRFFIALRNTTLIAFISVPLVICLAFLLASAINKEVYCRSFIRTSIFMPYVATSTAVAMVFSAVYSQYGLLNTFLRSIGIENPPLWLVNEKWALAAIIILLVWKEIGYNTLIFLAGLQGIPRNYYEAAEIDGANKFQQLVHITIPMISPTTFFLLITQGISAFKIFDIVKVLTKGGPGDSTNVLVNYIYTNGFEYYKMGYASAIAWVLFIIVFIITMLQWYGQKKWVNYVM